MATAFLRSTASGGADAVVTTAAAMWGKITGCLVAAGWSSVYQYTPGSDEVYFSNGESGGEKIWVRIRQSGNDIAFLLHQYFHTTNAPTEIPLDGSTVGLWRMNEASGSAVADASANAYNMTATAGTSVVTGRIGNARNFTRASSGWAEVPTDATLRTLAHSGEWSIECWVKPTGLTSWNGIFSITGSGAGTTELLGFYTQSYTPYVQWRNAANTAWVTAAASQALPADLWSHVAITRTNVGGGNYVVRFYINGVLVTTSASMAQGRAPQGSEIMYIGRAIDTVTSYPWNGVIDDLRFSNVVRTPEEIAAVYAAGSNVPGGHNRIGATTSETGTHTYTFSTGSNIDYLMIADKDNFCWYARNAAGTNWFGGAGILKRPHGVKTGHILTTNILNPGRNVVANLAADPIAAGYKVGDTVTILGQQHYGAQLPINSPAPWEPANTIPAFTAEILAITVNSVTLSYVPEKVEAGAMLGDDPQPVFLYTNTTNAQTYSASSIQTPIKWQAGAANLFLGHPSAQGNGHNSSGALAVCYSHAAEADPNNRTSRMLYAPWWYAERGFLPSKFYYHPRQTDALWSRIRDGKNNTDYVVYTISTVKHVMGPFPVASTATFTGVQVMNDPAEMWVEGLEVNEPMSDYADCEPTATVNGAAEQFNIDEALHLSGVPETVRPAKSPEIAGGGPYLLGDGDRVGSGGGSNFNNGFN